MRAVLGRLPEPRSAPTNRTGVAIVAGTTASDVFAYDLAEGRILWKKARRARSRPVVTPRAILVLEGDSVVALDPEDGRKLWEEPVEENFLGATGDADRVYVAFGTAVAATAPVTERRAGALLALSARDGDVVWRLETDRQFGAPAVLGDVVFVPWDRQYMSALEASSGKELARIRMRDDSVLFVTSWGGRLYYGARGLYRLAPGSATGRREGAVYMPPPEVDLPGSPTVWSDGFVPPQDEAAVEHIRVYVRPGGEGETLEAADGIAYYRFFKYVFGLAPSDGEVRWATRLDGDVLRAMAVEGGLVVATKAGHVLFLDAEKGLVRWRADLGIPDVVSVTFDVDGFRPEATLDPSERSLRESLLDVANDRDNRLVPARAFAAEALGKLPGEEVANDLIDIVSRRDVPQAIRDAAARGLVGRREGAGALLQALRARFDYLGGTLAPPVGPIATALGSLGDARAVAPLLDHLEDPATDREALPAIVAALGEIGDRRALAPLQEFVVRYHADDALGVRPAATKAAVDVLVALGRRPQRRALEELADDPHTLPDLRDHVRLALNPPPPPPEEEAAAGGPAPAAAATPPTPAARPSAAEQETTHDYAVPVRLGPAEIERTMGKAAPQLRRCFARGDPDAVRLVFVLKNDGAIERLTIQPGEERLRACLQQTLGRASFGRFRETRQQVSYRLTRQAPPPTKAPPTKAPPTKRSPTKR